MNTYSNDPLVSICIPVYNNENFIAETMWSVMQQTYKNLELVIVDDNSFDDSLSVVFETASKLVDAGYAGEYVDHTSMGTKPLDNKDSLEGKRDGSRIIYVYGNKQNLGMAGNWNRCMELCRGEFIKLICADDMIHPSLIEKEVSAMKKYPDVILVESDTEFRNTGNKSVGKYRRYGDGVTEGTTIGRHSLFTRDYFGAPLANLIRGSAYKELGGFDPDFSYIIDYEFFMRLACQGKVYVIREPLNYFRLREDSNTGKVLGGSEGNEYLNEHIKLVEKYAPILGLSRTQKKCSILMRRMMNFLGKIYLKMRL